MSILTSTWKARLSALFVGLATFGVFFATLNEGIFPGESARQAAIALRTEPGRSNTQFRQVEERASDSLSGNSEAVSLSVRENVVPYTTKFLLWRLAGMGAASLPFGALPFRLNLFSAICGALAAMLAFLVCRALSLLLAFHVCPLSALRRKNAAWISALAGTAALATSTPFWLAATRFLPQAFETLLLLCAAASLLRAAIRHQARWLAVFGFLAGLLAFETETGVYLLPLWCFFALRAMLVGDLTDSRGWTCLLSGLVLGVIVYLGLVQFMVAGEGVSLFTPVKEFLISTKVFRNLLLGGSLFEDQPRIICLCFAIIPFLAAAAMSIWRNNEEASSSSGFLLFVLACMAVVGISGLPISPWGAYSSTDGSVLPTTIYLMIAYVVAYLAQQGLLMAGGRLFPPPHRRTRRRAAAVDEDDVRASEHTDYPVGRVLAALMLVMAFAMAAWNFRIVRDWRDQMPDVFASSLIERMPPCTWFASEDGLLDSQMRVHARLAGRRLSVICTADTADTLPRLRRAVSRDAAFRGLATADLRGALISTNTDLFLSTWIRTDAAIGDKLMLADAAVWTEAGKPAVPALAGFKTTADESSVDWAAIARDHLAFWKRLEALGPLGPRAPLWLRQNRAALRQRTSNVGRQLAARLSAAAQTDLAREVLDAATAVRDEPVESPAHYSSYDTF